MVPSPEGFLEEMVQAESEGHQSPLIGLRPFHKGSLGPYRLRVARNCMPGAKAEAWPGHPGLSWACPALASATNPVFRFLWLMML